MQIIYSKNSYLKPKLFTKDYNQFIETTELQTNDWINTNNYLKLLA